MQSSHRAAPSPLLVALASWLIPGSGYVLLGERVRGITIGVTVILLFVLGVLIAGVRVIEVPGWDASGGKMYVRPTEERRPVRFFFDSVLFRRPISEIAAKPWYVPQFFVGAPILAASAYSISQSLEVAKPHARLAEIGTLYTAVAGMLNVLAGIDATYRASEGEKRA
jgi:hypothetical protein